MARKLALVLTAELRETKFTGYAWNEPTGSDLPEFMWRGMHKSDKSIYELTSTSWMETELNKALDTLFKNDARPDEVSVLVQTQEEVRANDEFRVLFERTRMLVDRARCPSTMFKLRGFDVFPDLYDVKRGTVREFVKAGMYRKSLRDALILVAEEGRVGFIRYQWKQTSATPELGDDLAHNVDKSIYELTSDDIQNALIATLNRDLPEVSRPYEVPVLVQTDALVRASAKFNFLPEQIRKCVDGARYPNGTRFKIRGFDISPATHRETMQLFVNAEMSRTYAVIVYAEPTRTCTFLNQWAIADGIEAPREIELVEMSTLPGAITAETGVSAFVHSLDKFVHANVPKNAGSIPLFLMQSAEMRRLKDRNDGRYRVAIEGMIGSAADLRDTSFTIQESIMIPGYDEREAVYLYYQSAILRGFYTKVAIILTAQELSLEVSVYELELIDPTEPSGKLKLHTTNTFDLKGSDSFTEDGTADIQATVKRALESVRVWIPRWGVGSIPVFMVALRPPDGRNPDVDQRVHNVVTTLVDSFRYAGINTRLRMQPGLEYIFSRFPENFERYFLPRDIVRRFFTTYAVVLNAGPTGTRVTVYRWDSWSETDRELPDITVVGERLAEGGMHTLAPAKIVAYVQLLLDHARDILPKFAGRIPLFLLSTGMRGLSEVTYSHLRTAIVAAIDADRTSTDDAAHATSHKLIEPHPGTGPEADAKHRRDAELVHPTTFKLEQHEVVSKTEESLFEWVALNYSLRHSRRNNDSPGFVDGHSARIAFFHSATDGKDYEGTVTRVKVGSTAFDVFMQTWPARGVDPGWRQDGKDLVMRDMLVPLVASGGGAKHPVLGCLLRDPVGGEGAGNWRKRTFYATSVYMHVSGEPAADKRDSATTDGGKQTWPEPKYNWNLPRVVFDQAVLIMKVLNIGFGVCLENDSESTTDKTANVKPAQHNTWPLGMIVLHAIEVRDETRARLGWSPAAK